MKKHVFLFVGLLASLSWCLSARGDAPRGFIGDTGSGWNTRSGVTGYTSGDAAGRPLDPNALDGSGISADGLTHVVGSPYGLMWCSYGTKTYENVVTQPRQWAQFKFYNNIDGINLDKIWIWNYNEFNGGSVYGMKDVTIYATSVLQFPNDPVHSWGSGNASDWTVLYDGSIPQVPVNSPAEVFIVDVPAAYKAIPFTFVMIVADAAPNHNWIGTGDTGLSEVRFYPVYASRHFIGDTGSGWDTTSGVVDSGASSAVYSRLTGNTINGSGINAYGLTHNTNVWGGMWLSDSGVDGGGVIPGYGTHFIVWLFDKAYSLDEMWIWNWNESNQWWDGPSCGMKQVRIIAANNVPWTQGTVVYDGIIPKATGTDKNPVNKVVDLGGVEADAVMMISVYGNEHNWSNGAVGNAGLSEVRFYRNPYDCAEAKAWGLEIAADFNSDCRVDFADFAVLAQNWLQCMDPQNPNCQ